MTRYDFIVLGSGPAGRRAAIQAAKLGRSVLVVDNRAQNGFNSHGTVYALRRALAVSKTRITLRSRIPKTDRRAKRPFTENIS